MRSPWNNWFHCTGSTYGTWLRGDPRGWRSRHHREHVQGDYKHPPPPGKYAGLHRYSRYIMKRDAIVLIRPQHTIAAEKLAEALLFHNVQLIELCVTPNHFHILCRFIIPRQFASNFSPNANASKIRTPRHLLGIAKKHAAHTLSSLGLTRPGGIWAVRTKSKPIRNRHHQLRVVNYIRAHKKHGAIVYTLDLNPTHLLSPTNHIHPKPKPRD